MRRAVRRSRVGPLLLICMAALAGCSGDKDVAPACPRVAVLNGAGSLTRFAPGAGRDLLDVDFQADIADFVAACDDKRKENDKPVAIVAVAPVFITTRGPANTSRDARLTYFVSVVDENQTILTKQTFDLVIDFSDNRNRVVKQDDDPPITVDVPNPKGTGARAYQILLGFQLTQDEIDYNQRQAAGGGAGGALISAPGQIK